MIIQYSRYLGWLRHPLTFWSVSFQRFQNYSSIIIIFNLTNKINILIIQMRLSNMFHNEVRKKEKSIFRLQGLTNPLSSCPGQVKFFAGQVKNFLTCTEKCMNYTGKTNEFQRIIAEAICWTSRSNFDLSSPGMTSLAQVWSRNLKSSIASCSRLHINWTISFQSIQWQIIMFQYYNNHLYLSGHLISTYWSHLGY